MRWIDDSGGPDNFRLLLVFDDDTVVCGVYKHGGNNKVYVTYAYSPYEEQVPERSFISQEAAVRYCESKVKEIKI